MTIHHLDDVVLAAVAQLGDDAYGVRVRERVGALLGGRVPSVGTVHRTLGRLERARLVAARMGEPSPVRGGRAKRLFALTAAGAGALARARGRAEERATALDPDWRPV